MKRDKKPSTEGYEQTQYEAIINYTLLNIGHNSKEQHSIKFKKNNDIKRATGALPIH
jgi:hypothetical protein